MNAKDRILLEEIIEDIGKTAVVNNIVKMSNDDARVNGGREIILEYLKRLEGFTTRLKEIHWNAENMSLHKTAEELKDDIEEFQDEISEDMMGYLGIRVKPGELMPTMPESTTLGSLVYELTDNTFEFHHSIKEISECLGIVSETEAFIHKIHKYSYLKELN